MRQPPQGVISRALAVAALSPCRSKRGVAIFEVGSGVVVGAGRNGPPAPLTCPGRERCAGKCGQLSVHAEMRALRSVDWSKLRFFGFTVSGGYDMVHVEATEDGGVAACEGPSCWQCSREILDVGVIGGVWLLEVVPEENCPHVVGLKRVDCPLCQGEECEICSGALFRVCDHDVLDRHRGLRTFHATWRRYTAEEFHRATLRSLGLEP